MAVTSVTYATREEVKQALDIKQTARNDIQVDRAIESATQSVEGLLHRVFYPTVATRFFDWPNYQYAYPWRLWLDHKEVADITVNVPVLTTGGVVIPASSIFWEPVNSGPPFTYLELDRSTTAAFGVNKTPQRDIQITGVFGYWAKTTPAGALAAAITDTTGTSVTVTNSATVGVGDNVLIDSERMLIADKTMVSTGQTQQGSGAGTASNADVTLAVTDGTKYSIGETLLLDSERMLIVDISGNNLTVKRAWDGTVLATHSGATVYSLRLLTVVRGALGTTAATHSNSVAVNRAVVPGLVKALTVAEAVTEVTRELGAYAEVEGSGGGKQIGIGAGLPDLRKRAIAQYGRKARLRVI